MDTETLDRLFRSFRDDGDGEALARLFDATAPRLLLIAAHFTRDAAEAEDLVQTAFLQAIRDAGRWDGTRPVGVWLASILRHRAIDHRRARERRGATVGDVRLEELAGGEMEPADLLAEQEVFERLEAAVAGLPKPYREVLALKLIHGLEPLAIAHTLGRPAATVRTQLARGLERLRDALPEREALLSPFLVAAVFAHEGRGLSSLRDGVLEEAERIGRIASRVAPSAAESGGIATRLLGLGLVVLGATWVTIRLFAFGAADFEAATVPLARSESEPAAYERFAATERDSGRVPVLVDDSPTSTTSPENADAGRAVIRGWLLDHDGEPVVGATVRVTLGFQSSLRWSEEAAAWKAPRTEVDEDGSFELRFDPLDGIDYLLTFRRFASDQAFWHMQVAVDPLGAGETLDVGRVQLPLTGEVFVEFEHSNPDAIERSLSVSGGTKFEVQLGHQSPKTARYSAVSRTLAGSASTLLQDVMPGMNSIEVSVRDEPNEIGTPVDVLVLPGERVRVGAPAPADPIGIELFIGYTDVVRGSLRSNEAVRVLDGSGNVVVSAPVHDSSGWIIDRLGPGTFTIEVDDPRFEYWCSAPVDRFGRVSASLVPSAVLAVTAVDAETSQVLDHIRVSNWYPDAPSDHAARELLLDPVEFENGIPCFRVLPDPQFVRIAAHGWITRTLFLDEELVPRAHQGLYVELERARRISGRVVDADGKPAFDRRVIAAASGASSAEPNAAPDSHADLHLFETVTDELGAFVFDELEPGTYDLVVDAPLGGAPFQLDVVADATELQFVLPRTVPLRGRTAPLFPGAERARVVLVAEPQASRSERVESLVARRSSVALARDGSFRFDALAVGRYEAWLETPTIPMMLLAASGASPARIGPFPIDVREGTVDEYVVELGDLCPGTADVDVRVGGRSVPGLRVLAFAADGSDPYPRGSGKTDLFGRARIAPLPPGPHRFEVSPEGVPWVVHVPGVHEVETGACVQASVDLELVPGTVVLVDDADRPLARASALVLGDGEPQSLTTDDSGEIELLLPVGDYDISTGYVGIERFGGISRAGEFAWPPDDTGRLLVRTRQVIK
ncbi:MAG: sigma-70 family RNA polymerase sigma factor [Planctomycetota bacterium]